MKSRKRLQLALNAATDQVPFDYALMSNLYVHSDGNDVLDFGGCTQKESKRVVQDLLVNESFATSNGTAAGQRPTTLLHIQVDPEDRSPMAPTHAADPPPPTSHLVSMEDSSTHIWIMTQPDEEHAPCARMFHSVVALKKFIQRRNLILPEPMEESESDSSSSSSSESPRLDATRGLPLAHWIDIQADSSCGRFSSIVSEVLAMFPLDTETVDRCTYLGGYDVIDTNHLTADAGSYVFVNLLCTPIISSTSVEPFDEGSEVGSSTASNAPINGNKKSVMEMRFDAMRKGKPTKSIPEPVAVAIIMFRDWMVTIHERAFAEFDDLLRLVQARCAPVATAPSPVQRGTGKLFSVLDSSYVEHLRFTTASIFVMLIQIAVGHNLDTVQLAGVVDELGDAIFELPDCTKPMEDDVIETITTIRRCFGECGAEVTRRENIVTTLLQPHLSSNFLMKDAYLRQQLLNVQAHLLRVQHELADCRDTVAMSNWHHNVVLQYSLLRRNNRTVRMVLLLSEMANIMYPVMMIQTLYAMNLKDPYEADVEPPLTSLGPFFIIAGCICAYLLLCARPLAAMIRRRPFETRLLA